MNNISIVIPVYNESGSIKNLVEEINKSLLNHFKYEIIIINDFSKDDTLSVINSLSERELFNIVTINNSKNMGQSYSIKKGVIESKYENIVTIDGDGQNDPSDIINLASIFFSKENLDLVGGLRLKRKDSFIKIISSRIANSIRSFVLKDGCRDTGCSLKIFNRKIFLNLPYFNGMHRFLPALFRGLGYNTKFINVNHRSRTEGKSKYGTIDRLVKGIIDLVRVKLIIKKHSRHDEF